MLPNSKELTKEIREIIKDEILKSLKKDNPVGHIRFEVTNTNPASYLGFGTWVLWGSGRVPVGVDITQTEFNEVEKTGGEKEHNLDLEELPGSIVAGETSQKNWATCAWGDFSNSAYPLTTLDNPNNQLTHGTNHQAHNNLQPFVTCYMWKRTA